jgi:hypothetical protein
MGQLLRLVRLYARHQIARVPRGQADVASGRLGTGARAAAGQRDGTSGSTLGNAPRTWAFSAAAVLGRSDQPAAQHSLARVENTQDQGQALTLLAHP